MSILIVKHVRRHNHTGTDTRMHKKGTDTRMHTKGTDTHMHTKGTDTRMQKMSYTSGALGARARARRYTSSAPCPLSSLPPRQCVRLAGVVG